MIEQAIGASDKIRPIPESLWWGDDRFQGAKNTGECTSWVSYEFFLEAYLKVSLFFRITKMQNEKFYPLDIGRGTQF